jgi:hypothetical protein
LFILYAFTLVGIKTPQILYTRWIPLQLQLRYSTRQRSLSVCYYEYKEHVSNRNWKYVMYETALQAFHKCSTSVYNCFITLIPGFRRDVDVICGLLGNYTASCGNYLPTFRDKVSVPSSRVKIPRRKESRWQGNLAA